MGNKHLSSRLYYWSQVVLQRDRFLCFFSVLGVHRIQALAKGWETGTHDPGPGAPGDVKLKAHIQE